MKRQKYLNIFLYLFNSILCGLSFLCTLITSDNNYSFFYFVGFIFIILAIIVLIKIKTITNIVYIGFLLINIYTLTIVIDGLIYHMYDENILFNLKND